VVAD
jgi:hypothetical protein